MALHSLRLRRALSLSSYLLHHSLHQPKPVSSTFSHVIPSFSPAPSRGPVPSSSPIPFTRPFTSTTTLLRKTFDPETDEIGPDTILFEGCDYNHWLITMDFPKDSNLTREQMIETYVNTAAQIFGSVEEAKKKIYALSTTTYQGFQVECSEETSEKFKSLPGVVFVLPDSYIDPVNKEYGGDKYVNGEIFPRPPPVYYGRRNSRDRDRRPREQVSYQQGNPAYINQGPMHSEARNHGQNYGAPSQQNYGPPPPPPPQQNYGPPPPPPPQQNYGPPPPPQQSYGPPPLPPQQNYGPPPPPPQQNYGPPPPRQNYGPPPQQNYGPPQRQNFGPPQQNYGPPQQSYRPSPQQSYVPPPQQSYGNSPNFSPQQSYGPPGSAERRGPMPPSNASGHGERNPIPSYQGNFNQAEPGNHFSQGQRDFQGSVPPEHRTSPQDANYGSSQGGSFGQVSGGQRNFSSIRNN